MQTPPFTGVWLGCQVGDRKAAVKLLVRHSCWQKLLAISASLDPGRSSAHIQDLVTELRAASRLELAVQILLDIGETKAFSSILLLTLVGVEASVIPDELMHRMQHCTRVLFWRSPDHHSFMSTEPAQDMLHHQQQPRGNPQGLSSGAVSVHAWARCWRGCWWRQSAGRRPSSC